MTTQTTRGSVSQRKNGQWVANLTGPDGKRRQLFAKTKKEAQERLAAALQDITSRPVTARQAAAGFSLKQARELAMDRVWDGKPCSRTTAIYSLQICQFFGPNTPVVAVTAPDVERFREDCIKKGNKPSTINKKVSALRVMREMAIKYGGVESLPQLQKNLPVFNQKDRIYTHKEVSAICDYLLTIGSVQHASLFVFLVEMGCRISEAFRLRGEHVDLQAGTVTFYKKGIDNKTGNRTIPMTPRAKAAIEPFMPPMRSLPVWTLNYAEMRYAMDKAIDAVGLTGEGVGIHTARHTCGSRLARAGMSLLEIKTWLGHRTTAACERYLHLDATRLDRCLEVLKNYQEVA